MIVSHRHRFIFLKTRKTGGTSIELALRALCGPEDVVAPVAEDRGGKAPGTPRNYLHDRSGWRLADRIAWALAGDRALKRFPRIGYFSHTTATRARETLPPHVWDTYFKISVERNPWDRQVSHYFWKNRRNPGSAPEFARYLARTVPLDNWSIYAIGDRVVADHVIRYGDLEKGLQDALALIGVPAPDGMARAKSQYRTARRPYQDFYTDETREMVAAWYAREIAHFGWTFDG